MVGEDHVSLVHSQEKLESFLFGCRSEKGIHHRWVDVRFAQFGAGATEQVPQFLMGGGSSEPLKGFDHRPLVASDQFCGTVHFDAGDVVGGTVDEVTGCVVALHDSGQVLVLVKGVFTAAQRFDRPLLSDVVLVEDVVAQGCTESVSTPFDPPVVRRQVRYLVPKGKAHVGSVVALVHEVVRLGPY